CLAGIANRVGEEKLALLPIELRVPDVLVLLVSHRDGLGEDRKRFLALPSPRMRLGEQPEEIGASELRTCFSVRGDPPANLRLPLASLTSLGGGPAVHDE